MRRWLMGLLIITAVGLLFLFTYKPPLSEKQGQVDTQLFLSDSTRQPLIVGFGGGSGGNDWARDYMADKRQALHDRGYAVLAVGYFGTENTSTHLDRISLDAIADTIGRIAQHPNIDEHRIALIGGSRGGELALNLGSYFEEFRAVVSLSGSHVSFPAITWSANTSSWTLDGQPVPYVPAPLKVIGPVLRGDLYEAHSIILDNEEAVHKALIPVDRINGPVLLMSGKADDQWPSTRMSEQIIRHLREQEFRYDFQHIILEGGHEAPLDHFDYVLDFLEKVFP